MNYREKAKKLVDKYHKELNPNWKTFYDAGKLENAKQCALIAVDEILKNYKEDLKLCQELHPHAEGLIAGNIFIWQKVKQEITKL